MKKSIASALGVFLFCLLMHAPDPAHADPFAYITGQDSNVWVIDVATNTVVTTFSLYPDYPSATAVSPDGAVVYISAGHTGEGAIHVIDTATHTSTDRIALDFSPLSIAVSPDGSRVYGVDPEYSSVVVVDTAAKSVVDSVEIGEGHWGIEVLPDGSRGYVTNGSDDVVSVFDTSTGTEIANIDLSSVSACYLVAHPYWPRVYVTLGGTGVSVIDTDTNTEIETIEVGMGPMGIAINPEGTRVYTANGTSNSVTVIDTESNTAVATIPVGLGPNGLAVTPSGTRVYVACRDQDVLTVIDALTNSVIGEIEVMNMPSGMGKFITPGARMAAMPDFYDFGDVDVGLSSPQRQFTVSNLGIAPLEIFSVSTSGDDAQEFEITSNACTAGLVLNPQAACNVGARFSPDTYGDKRASIRIAYNPQGVDAYHIELAGRGYGPYLSVIGPDSPPQDLRYNFGEVEINHTSDVPIAIRNTGNADLDVGGIAAADPLAAPFSLLTAEDNCSRQTLAPMEVCHFSVRFSPTDSGIMHSDTFDIPSNTPQTLTFTLEGRGIPEPFVDIFFWDQIPPTNDYLVPLGDVPLGDSSQPVYIRYQNRGSVDGLVIESVELTGPDAGEFSVLMLQDPFMQDHCGPTPPFAVRRFAFFCEMVPFFNPTSAGEKTATLEITSNDPDEALVVYTLTGRGMGPEIDVTDSIDPPDDHQAPFGEITVGRTVHADIMATNLGTTDLTMDNIHVAGDPDFALDLTAGPFSCDITTPVLPPSRSCTLAVSFTPSSTDEKTGALRFASNDPDESAYAILLSGTGVPAEEPDAGTPDGQDAGGDEPDAGDHAASDASDAGTDAGTDGGDPGGKSDGCDCAQLSPAFSRLSLLGLALLLFRKRKRQSPMKH